MSDQQSGQQWEPGRLLCQANSGNQAVSYVRPTVGTRPSLMSGQQWEPIVGTRPSLMSGQQWEPDRLLCQANSGNQAVSYVRPTSQSPQAVYEHHATSDVKSLRRLEPTHCTHSPGLPVRASVPSQNGKHAQKRTDAEWKSLSSLFYANASVWLLSKRQ